MQILSIQSWVAYGHVGNASAVFPLQRSGAEVWAIHTVQFSNHPAYGDWTGQVFAGEEVARLVDGIERRGVLGGCDAVLSGYMGEAAIGEAILDAVGRVRRHNAGALYCCDPVIGDVGTGVYVRPGIPALLRERAMPQADIATPNAFELAALTGLPSGTLAEAKRAVAALQARMRRDGPGIVLLTSLHAEDTPSGFVDLLAAEGGSVHRLRTPLLPVAAHGAGDAIAALFLFHRLRTGSAAAALDAAASSVFGLLRRTVEAGSSELLLVAAQDEIVAPTIRFRSEPC